MAVTGNKLVTTPDRLDAVSPELVLVDPELAMHQRRLLIDRAAEPRLVVARSQAPPLLQEPGWSAFSPFVDGGAGAAFRRLTEATIDTLSMPVDPPMPRGRRLAGLTSLLVAVSVGVVLVGGRHAGWGESSLSAKISEAGLSTSGGSSSQRMTAVPAGSDGSATVGTSSPATAGKTESNSGRGSSEPARRARPSATGNKATGGKSTISSSTPPASDIGAPFSVGGFELEVFRDPSVCSSLVPRSHDGDSPAGIPAAGPTNKCPAGRSSSTRKP
jgi:hypothetical protein